jgi:hypothetical protein
MTLGLFEIIFPSFSVTEGLLPWEVGEVQEGGEPPPVLGDAFAVEYPYRYSKTKNHSHDTQGSKYRLVVYGEEGNLCEVVGVVDAVTLGVNVSIKHHGELTIKCKLALFICVVACNCVLSFLPSSSSRAYIIT